MGEEVVERRLAPPFEIDPFGERPADVAGVHGRLVPVLPPPQVSAKTLEPGKRARTPRSAGRIPRPTSGRQCGRWPRAGVVASCAPGNEPAARLQGESHRAVSRGHQVAVTAVEHRGQACPGSRPIDEQVHLHDVERVVDGIEQIIQRAGQARHVLGTDRRRRDVRGARREADVVALARRRPVGVHARECPKRRLSTFCPDGRGESDDRGRIDPTAQHRADAPRGRRPLSHRRHQVLAKSVDGVVG